MYSSGFGVVVRDNLDLFESSFLACLIHSSLIQLLECNANFHSPKQVHHILAISTTKTWVHLGIFSAMRWTLNKKLSPDVLTGLSNSTLIS